MKPYLACDVDLDKLRYPIMGFPKIDGVRGLNIDNRLVARSGKPFKNLLNGEYFSKAIFNGFDGEMVVNRITGSGICNETNSALTTIKGTVPTCWCLFDYVKDGYNDNITYLTRYNELLRQVQRLYELDEQLTERLWVIPFTHIKNRTELEEFELKCLNEGYEGVILRDRSAKYKYGRGTVKEGGFLRLKRFLDSEIIITHVLEGQTNNNELKRNPHGQVNRSTIAENMIRNGKIGTICGKTLEDVKFQANVIIKKDSDIEISAGKMTHKDREYFFKNQGEILGRIAKYQFFPIGIKDKPRFPTFQGFRLKIDM